MFLESLQLSHFRNLKETQVSLNPRFNYVYGDNGAGKTALLEAIYLLSRGRSFRSGQAQTIITHSEKEFVVLGRTNNEVGDEQHNLGLSKTTAGETRIRIDGLNANRSSELARLLSVQVVLPGAADLIFQAPGLRRSYLDFGLFHVEPNYLQTSRSYRQALQQRNAWLKAAEDSVVLEDDPWLDQVTQHGIRLSEMRDGYVASLLPHLESAMSALAPEIDLSINYQWGGLEDSEIAAKKLSESFPRDVKFGVTHRGPHRADLELLSEGYVAAEVLSRGQAKAAAIALILAQASLQQALTKRESVILIDDFGAELDAAHWQRFVQGLQALNCQVIATSTDAPAPNSDWFDALECDVFHVEQGQITKMERAK